MGKHDHHHDHSQRRGDGTGHKFDPSRLERLRDPERLKTQNPDLLWEVLSDGLDIISLVDIGVGIGFFAIPFARKMEDGVVFGCDLNEDMLQYLKAAMEQEEVENIDPVKCEEVAVPLEDDIADALIMVNLHHELDYRDRSLAECQRLLREGGKIAVVDWKPIKTEHGPPLEMRIPPEQVRDELMAAGFKDVTEHEIMPEHYCLTAWK